MKTPLLRPFPIAAFLFFLSGALGLGYELVWIRKAVLVVGASQFALSTVLTAFFMGLGLGSYVVGKYLRSSQWSPLFLYGLFEIAIGLFALAFPWLFELLEHTYGSLYPLVAGSNVALFTVRFLLLFILCLIPTFFMGGTLPLLLDGLVEQDRSIGSRTSVLYGINILGAVAGVLITCYFAIPALGMNGTSMAGGVGNLLIGAVAAAFFLRLRPVHTVTTKSSLGLYFPLLAFGSGFLAIAYQVCWARYFSLFNTGTVYLTAILLAVYLLALATGSFILAPLLQARHNPLRILGVVQAVIPLLTFLTLEAWRLAEFRFSILADNRGGQIVMRDTLEISTNEHWRLFGEIIDAIFFAPLFQVALVIFIPVTLIGLGLPAIIAAATRRSADLRSVSGRVVFWNTIGSSVGGFIAGYALIPMIGLHYTLVALGLGSLGLSLTALLRSSNLELSQETTGEESETVEQAPVKPRTPQWCYGATVIGLVGVSIFASFAVAREDVSSRTIKYHGYGRDVGYRPNARAADRPMPLVDLVEGPFNTSFVFKDDRSIRMGSGNVCLAVVYDQGPSTQAVQGHIPCLFFPKDTDPENCLGICLGSGQSFGAMLLYDIRRLDVVDISKEIVDLALRHYKEYNHGLAEDDRVTFHLDDGRHYVERCEDNFYDVISMEPPPPTADGVASLYSLEFYGEVSRALRDHGVFMQWLPLYRITPLDAKGIIKTQAKIFPETFVVKVGRDDFMVVSYKTRPTFKLADIRRRCAIFEKERNIKGARWTSGCKYDMATVEGVLALMISGPEDIEKMTAPMLYDDDTQILSYSSGDRWLLRRYEGPALSSISFAALKLTNIGALNAYLDPPLSREQIGTVASERAASLTFFQVPDPQRFGTLLQVFNTTRDPGQKIISAINMARALDRVLAKEDAFQFVDQALAVLQSSRAVDVNKIIPIARSIVRHRLAVYVELTDNWIKKLIAKYPASPVVQAMKYELDAFQRREQKRLSGYLFQ